MNDKGISILDCYELTVLRTYRGRGALVLETDKGLKILREYSGNSLRLVNQDQLMHKMQELGVQTIDTFVKNKSGELLTSDKDHVNYVMKEWSTGGECDVRNKSDVEKASENLAIIHKSMIFPEGVNRDQKVITLYEQCQKHTKELKKIRNFMRNRGQKSEFENYYLENFYSFFDRAIEITEELQKQDDEQLYEDVLTRGIFCHGDYNYHNILMGEDVFTINFEHYSNDTRVKDLANICRKISEKNNWNVEMGHVMLDSYQKEYPLSKSEWANLYYRLAYPEKFWKISNYYFNHSKAWIPDKNKEKLTNLIVNEEKRLLFLKELF